MEGKIGNATLKKSPPPRLHNAARVVELLGPQPPRGAAAFFRPEKRSMKRLLILAVVAIMTASTVGCHCCSWWRQDQCDPCDPCADGAYGDPYLGEPALDVPAG